MKILKIGNCPNLRRRSLLLLGIVILLEGSLLITKYIMRGLVQHKRVQVVMNPCEFVVNVKISFGSKLL